MSGPRCSSCDYTFEDCVCFHENGVAVSDTADTTPEPKPIPPLWNEDESWSNEALSIDDKFGRIARSFIKEYPEYRVRELEILMISAVGKSVLEAILEKRFG